MDRFPLTVQSAVPLPVYKLQEESVRSPVILTVAIPPEFAPILPDVVPFVKLALPEMVNVVPLLETILQAAVPVILGVFQSKVLTGLGNVIEGVKDEEVIPFIFKLTLVKSQTVGIVELPSALL